MLIYKGKGKDRFVQKMSPPLTCVSKYLYIFISCCSSIEAFIMTSNIAIQNRYVPRRRSIHTIPTHCQPYRSACAEEPVAPKKGTRTKFFERSLCIRIQGRSEMAFLEICMSTSLPEL